MTTAEEELEAAIWQAMQAYRVTTDRAIEFIDAMVLAAQRYAAGDSPVVTALRRRVLHRDTAKQTSASTGGGVARTAPELHPGGPAHGPQEVGDGGATLSTGASIPGSVTRHDTALSTGVEAGYPQAGTEAARVLGKLSGAPA